MRSKTPRASQSASPHGQGVISLGPRPTTQLFKASGCSIATPTPPQAGTPVKDIPPPQDASCTDLHAARGVTGTSCQHQAVTPSCTPSAAAAPLSTFHSVCMELEGVWKRPPLPCCSLTLHLAVFSACMRRGNLHVCSHCTQLAGRVQQCFYTTSANNKHFSLSPDRQQQHPACPPSPHDFCMILTSSMRYVGALLQNSTQWCHLSTAQSGITTICTQGGAAMCMTLVCKLHRHIVCVFTCPYASSAFTLVHSWHCPDPFWPITALRVGCHVHSHV